MPPKPQITIIKFKRNKTTYVVPLMLSNKKNLTREYFTSSLTEAINASGGLRMDVDDLLEDGTQVEASELELAFPKTKESPYDNEWIAIEDDGSLKTVVLNDYDILAFRTSEEGQFHVEQAQYDDQEV